MGRNQTLIALALALSLAGCSFFMAKDRTWRESARRPRCSASALAPIADTVLASVLGSAAIYFLWLAPENEENGCAGTSPICERSYNTIAILSAAAAGFYVLGAYTGFGNRCACRDANLKYAEERRRANEADQPKSVP